MRSSIDDSLTVIPMQTATPAAPYPKSRIWAGRIMSGLVVFFLTADSIMKLMHASFVLKEMERLGLPVNLTVPIGIILLTCTILYAVPRTSVLGAILLTGYFGGAVLTHLRAGDPLLSHALFPIYMGVVLWGGLFARDKRLRALIPWRTSLP